MTVRFTVDDSRQEAAFRRLLDIGAATTACERILARQFAESQRDVHVITGSLRGSGDIDSDQLAGRWSGQISYGGPSPGFVNDPVDYAAYEAARGGPHNFAAGVYAGSGQYRAAMVEHLESGR